MINIVDGLLRTIESSNLKNLNLANNKLSRDSARPLAKLLSSGHMLTNLNISYNRLEDPGICEILDSLVSNDTLLTLSIKYAEASHPSWIKAKDIFSNRNSCLKEVFVWGNNFQDQRGALAIQDMIESGRFIAGQRIDLQPYDVDGKILLAEDGDFARKAESKFHWLYDEPV